MDRDELQSLLEPSLFEKEEEKECWSSNKTRRFLLVISVFILLTFCALNPSLKNILFIKSLSSFSESFPENLENTCIFPKFDVFDPEIMEYYKNVPVCKGELRNITGFKKGKLLNNQPDIFECWGRCHTFKNGNATFVGRWFHANQNYSFPCDIIESHCSEKNQTIENASYYFMHTQVVEVPQRKLNFTANGKQYDVYFIVVDSQSHSQLFRNLNKTNNFLLNEMEAVAFPHVNKVGDGSTPNGFAWFYGKITERVDRSPYNMPSLEPEPAWKNYCSRNLENETMIINEFRDYGYMTSHIPDWWRTVDFGCYGTEKNFADHSYTPYGMSYEYNTKMIDSMAKKQCIHRHQHALEYLGQFVESYNDKPKMALVWLTWVGHNSERGSADADPHFLELFEKHKAKFDDSFVFLAGDHGLRFTDAIITKVGSIDINNPALIITVPKELRSNQELMAILKNNSNALQTHYDTRATLLDILKFQPAVNFSDRSLKTIKGELGNSLLREQPKPRTCRSLPIPPPYCICENQMEADILKKNPEKAQLIGQNAIDLINSRLSKNTKVNQCRKWIFKASQKLVQFSKNSIFSVQGLFLATNDRKVQAKFKAFLGGPNESSLEIVTLTRVDSYKHAGDCVKGSLQSICDCY